MSGPVPRARRALAILGAQLVLLTLVFLAAELWARSRREGGLRRGLLSFLDDSVPSDPGTKGFFVHDADLNYRVNPSIPGMNSLGFRGPEVARPKPEGRFRVLVVGDSVAWPKGGFVAMLAEELRRRDGARAQERIEVLDAGIPGYTTWQERLFLARLLEPVDPDVVVLEYCLNDNHRFVHRLTDGGEWLLTSEARASLFPEGNGWTSRFARWSYLLFDVRMALLERRGAAEGERPWEADPAFAPAWGDASWTEQEEHLLAMRDSVRARGAAFVVVAVPYEPQLDRVRLARGREDVLKPQRRLASICGAAGIPFLDLEPAFEAATSATRASAGLYLDKIHFSKEGHAIASREVLAFLDRLALLPAPTSR